MAKSEALECGNETVTIFYDSSAYRMSDARREGAKTRFLDALANGWEGEVYHDAQSSLQFVRRNGAGLSFDMKYQP